jgi:hypothetical protein
MPILAYVKAVRCPDIRPRGYLVTFRRYPWPSALQRTDTLRCDLHNGEVAAGRKSLMSTGCKRGID